MQRCETRAVIFIKATAVCNFYDFFFFYYTLVHYLKSSSTIRIVKTFYKTNNLIRVRGGREFMMVVYYGNVYNDVLSDLAAEKGLSKSFFFFSVFSCFLNRMKIRCARENTTDYEFKNVLKVIVYKVTEEKYIKHIYMHNTCYVYCIVERPKNHYFRTREFATPLRKYQCNFS